MVKPQDRRFVMMTLVTDIHMKQLDILLRVLYDPDECNPYSCSDVLLPYKHQTDIAPMLVSGIEAMYMA